MLDKKKRGIVLMNLIILLFIGSFLFPIRKAKDKTNFNNGYICEIIQTTGPWWKVKEILGNKNTEVQIGDLVYVKGYDPYENLKTSVLNGGNLFYFDVSRVETIYDNELEEEFKVIVVENWEICYPIQREFGDFSFRKKNLNIYDFKWF